MLKMKKSFLFVGILLISMQLWANPKVYPTHWYVGMKDPSLQILLRGENIADGVTGITTNYPGVTVNKVHFFGNKNYIAVDLTIAAGAKAGVIGFQVQNTQKKGFRQFKYELKNKNAQNGRSRIVGVDTRDLIYLIMPDRFSNGDPSNDRVKGMLDQSLNRQKIFDRHGGDLLGVQNKLDYLSDIGVTAIWLNPVLTTDMPGRSEHGYSTTDHYEVDPRLGGNKAYYQLADAIHAKGMKLIQDVVYNHIGTEHFLYKDMPDSSWFHWWDEYTNTTYKDQVLMDPYASEIDKKRMSDGWFVPSMADLNHHNIFVEKFLIQHALWSTEEFGLDGWRIDTYAYNDLDFMNRCNAALLEEYPQLLIFGETWVHGIPNQSFFVANHYDIPYKSNLPGVTDFQLNLYGILPALNEKFGWTEGVSRLQLTTSNDFVYKDPNRNVIFLDNHDVSRFFSMVGEDIAKMKMAINWLLTFRGIPQVYYGTEILMKNFADPDGKVREDFPGGWKEDSVNKFESSGRTAMEEAFFQHFKKLANYRKKSSALSAGKFMHYVPEDGVYVYFRYDDKETVMCVMNPEEENKTFKLKRFSERIKGAQKAREVVTDKEYELKETFTVPAKELLILKLTHP